MGAGADGAQGAERPAQRLWQAAEAVHAIVYFDRDVRRAVRAAGAPGFWAGYFGTRLAPLRTVDPWLATSVLYVFAPGMVTEHLPSSDDGARSDEARRIAVAALLSRLGAPSSAGAASATSVTSAESGGSGVSGAPPAEAWLAAVDLVRRLAEACEVGGRPLFAAHAGRPWPEDPHLALWHGVTLLREHRGDGHLHVLAGEGLSGCEAMVLALRWRGQGEAGDDSAAADRGWSDDDIAHAYAGLAERGWVGPDRALTDAGHRARAAIEAATDARSVPRAADPATIEAAAAALEPFASLTLPTIPARNPIGITGGAQG